MFVDEQPPLSARVLGRILVDDRIACRGNCWSSSKCIFDPWPEIWDGWPSTPRPQLAMSSSWDTVVSGVAGAEIVPPVPCVVVAIRLVGTHRRRPDPEIIVEPVRRLGRLLVSDVGPALRVPRLGRQDVADRAFAQELDAVAKDLGASALGPDLHDPIVTPGGVDHELPFADIVAAGLLDVDMFAGRRGQKRHRRGASGRAWR